ncbi:MAG: DNA primase, partial [Candidatus Omnitrophota bacterium]
ISSYIPLKKTGRNFKASSPFKQERTPSFFVSPDKQIFHCFSSGIGGNAISFVMKMERLTFPEAVRKLAERYNVVIPEDPGVSRKDLNLEEQIRKANALAVDFFHRNLLVDKSPAAATGRAYLKKRGINLEVAKSFQLGFALDEWDALIKYLQQQKITIGVMEKAGLILPRKSGQGYYDRFRNRIIFPIFDEYKRPIAFGARALEKDNPAKYLNSPETPIYLKGRHLYGFHFSKNAAAEGDQLIVVEGYMDFIMPFVSGIHNIAASLGTALTVEQIRLIRRYTRNIVMLYDGDPAGESAMYRSLDMLIEEGINARVAVLPDGEDPDSYVRAVGVEEFRKRIRESRTVFDFKLDFLTARYGRETVESRSKIASEMLATVARFKDPISRTEAVYSLARALSVVQNASMTEGALIRELDRLADKGTGKREQETKEKDVTSSISVSPAEQTLLILMLVDYNCLKFVRDSNVPGLFSTKDIDEFVNRLFEIYERDREISLPVLISECDERLGDFVSGLMAKEDSMVGDKMKMCRDCLHRLLENSSREKRKKILFEMEKARGFGDQQRLAELTEEFNRLLKGVL